MKNSNSTLQFNAMSSSSSISIILRFLLQTRRPPVFGAEEAVTRSGNLTSLTMGRLPWPRRRCRLAVLHEPTRLHLPSLVCRVLAFTRSMTLKQASKLRLTFINNSKQSFRCQRSYGACFRCAPIRWITKHSHFVASIITEHVLAVLHYDELRSIVFSLPT